MFASQAATAIANARTHRAGNPLSLNREAERIVGGLRMPGRSTDNWFNYGTWRKQLLSDIAGPRTLKTKDNHYTLTYRFDAAPRVVGGSDYLRFNTPYRAAPIPFDLNVPDGPKTIQIPVAEIPKTAELWMALNFSQPGDVLRVSLNDNVLEPAELATEGRFEIVGDKAHFPPGNGMIGFPATASVDMQFLALRWSVPVDALTVGRNKLTIELKKRGPGLDQLLRVSRVELAT